MRSNYLLSFLCLATSSIALSEPKSVFAHFLVSPSNRLRWIQLTAQVGNAADTTPAQWVSDITQAQEAHIDGFALNIGPQDGYTDQVLERAYQAAETVGNFSLFLSFDYASAGPWPAARVIRTINKYKSIPAQFYYKGKPLVSTFEGVDNAGDWPSIKSATGCGLIPDWTSLGPSGIVRYLDSIDGAFSWDAWPVGAQDKNVDSDKAWMDSLGGKAYMMPVAPWFYTNLPQWRKNWLWRGDDLWHHRWQQVMDLQPDLVQVWSFQTPGSPANPPRLLAGMITGRHTISGPCMKLEFLTEHPVTSPTILMMHGENSSLIISLHTNQVMGPFSTRRDRRHRTTTATK